MSAVNTNLPSEVIKTLIDLTGETTQELAVARVEKINNDKTVNVCIVSGTNSNKIFHSVRMLSPYKSGESGIIAMPEVGSIALVAIVNTAYQFIIGYLNYHDNITQVVNETKEGEMIFKTPFGSYVKMGEDNTVDIHTGENSSLFLGKEMIIKAAESNYTVDVAGERFSGVEGNIVHNSEKWYDEDIKSNQSNSELIESIGDLLYPYAELEDRKPILEISKGNVLDSNNEKVTLSVFESKNPEAAYRIKINSEGKPGQILIGKDGSIQIEANVIKIKSKKIDLTDTPKMTVSNMNIMKEGD